MEGNKVRPALIISNDNFNKFSEHRIMVPITSVIKKEPYSVIINSNDLNAGKLLKQSRIKADRIFCVERDLIMMSIGSVKGKIFDKVKAEIMNVL